MSTHADVEVLGLRIAVAHGGGGVSVLSGAHPGWDEHGAPWVMFAEAPEGAPEAVADLLDGGDEGDALDGARALAVLDALTGGRGLEAVAAAADAPGPRL